MSKKKKIFIFCGIIAVIALSAAGAIKFNNYLEGKIIDDIIAGGGFPYQIGLTNVSIINCVTSGNPPVCTGGTLCSVKDAASCANYSDVSGTQAGGDGNNALFSNTAITESGLKPGGQLIAGCTSPALCDNGVLASDGGCYNCDGSASSPDGTGDTIIVFGDDDDGDDGDDGDDDWYNVEVIGTTDHIGFFSLGEFNGKLYAGTYNLGGNQNLYSYPSWEQVSSIGAGESIYDIAEYNGSIYLNTENRGRIFKSSDGYNFEQVFQDTQDDYVLGFGLIEFQGNLYASTQTMPEYNGYLRIWKTSDGENWNEVSLPKDTTKFWVKDFIEYKNKLYAFISDMDNSNEVGYFVTSDGSSWSWVDLKTVVGEVGLKKSVVWNDDLWIVGKNEDSDNYYKVFKFDGTNIIEMYMCNNTPHVTDIVLLDDILYIADSAGWNATEGNASLYKSSDGSNWQKVYDFPEPESTDMQVYDGALYITTKHSGVGGKVYKYTSGGVSGGNKEYVPAEFPTSGWVFTAGVGHGPDDAVTMSIVYDDATAQWHAMGRQWGDEVEIPLYTSDSGLTNWTAASNNPVIKYDYYPDTPENDYNYVDNDWYVQMPNYGTYPDGTLSKLDNKWVTVVANFDGSDGDVHWLTSSDGFTWDERGDTGITTGPDGSSDKGEQWPTSLIYNPDNKQWYLYYFGGGGSGGSSASGRSMGVASGPTPKDLTEWDGSFQSYGRTTHHGTVLKDTTGWIMVYQHEYGATGEYGGIFYARSDDMLNWTEMGRVVDISGDFRIWAFTVDQTVAGEAKWRIYGRYGTKDEGQRGVWEAVVYQ